MQMSYFTIYADFECIIDENSKQHHPCGYAYKVVSTVPGFSNDVVAYRGLDAATSFLTEMDKEVADIGEIYENVHPMELDNIQQQEFEICENCHICEKIFEDDDVKVRDHCHVTGNYRGAAHQGCNLNFQTVRENYKVPIVFHNLKVVSGSQSFS